MACIDLERIIHAMRHGVVVHALDGSITQANQAAADALGLTLDQLVGRASIDPNWRVVREDGSTFEGDRHPSMVTLRTGEPQSGVVMGVPRSDGSLAWLSVSSEPLYQEEGGELSGAVVSFVDISEQRRIADVLFQSEQLYRTIFESARVGILYNDLDGNVIKANPYICSFLGYRQEELVGHHLLEITCPDDRSQMQHVLSKLNERDSLSRSMESRYLHKDGRECWAEVTLSAVTDAGGVTIAHMATVLDIDARKRAEQALIENQLRLYNAEQIASLGSWEWNIPADTYYWSDQVYRNFGLRPGEVDANHENHLATIHPEDREMVTAVINDAVRLGASFNFSYRCIHPDGTVVHLLSVGEVELDARGEPVRMFGTCQDITDRVKVESALRDSEQLFRAFFQYAPFGAVLSDRNGAVFRTNLALQQMFGFTEEEFLSLHFRDYTVEEDIEPNMVLFNELVAGKRDSYQMEKRYLRKDGSVFWGGLAVTAIRDEQGEVKTIFSMVKDITERIESQREQNKLQRQLQQAQKMEAIGQLTGGIAHDFNNILASILGYSELALEYLLPSGQEKLEHALQEIMRSGKRAESLVTQMLEFGRGRPSLLEATHIDAVLKDVMDMAAATIPSSIQLNSELDPSLPPFKANPVQLHQVLLNLVINARDALEGKGRIDIKATRRQMHGGCDSCHGHFSGDYVELAIRDSAGAMSGDVLARAFDPFFTTKPVGRGTGMGLSMVHGIVHEWDGHIRVTLEPGVATTFYLYLPVFPETEQQEEASVVVGDAAVPRRSMQGAHLLVVDDEAVLGRFLEEALTYAGYQVTLFTDSRAAAAEFHQHPERYDLLLTDQTMPHMTGVELIESIHATRPELPVVLCSGYSEQVNAENAAEFGIDLYLPKPIETTRLYAALDALLMRTVAGKNGTDH